MEEQAKKQRKRCRTLETDSSEDEGQTNASANNCQPNESTGKNIILSKYTDYDFDQCNYHFLTQRRAN